MHESNIITVNSLLLLGTIALGAKSACFFVFFLTGCIVRTKCLPATYPSPLNNKVYII